MKQYIRSMKIEKFLNQNPSFQIVVAGNAIFQKVSEGLAGHELGMMDALILVAIFFENDKAARPTQLKEAFGIPKANVSHSIRALEKKKLLKRSIHDSDARGYVLDLTPKGARTAVEVISYFDKLQGRIERKCDAKSLDSFHRTLAALASVH
ncbi:MarR family winged helix-turn-helix transcriptional regulator [Bdellovibrio bacteriovorus]|uniref:Transcriptional regulator, MarR family n=1 Tax=Bdellovibrio bacteriovorus str. Tiberius TaxID=1069642 RepID=K7YWX2_BDEBC|nr:MarR family transcriptional regulator [Bdellovibrio bacteriovorus]AFY01225.1 transcriptional regulator, MarR family [Bdellovibrio bacteriovorus str. Tiberius]